MARATTTMLREQASTGALTSRYLTRPMNSFCADMLLANKEYLSVFEALRNPPERMEVLYVVAAFFPFLPSSERPFLESIPLHGLSDKVANRIAEAVLVLGGDTFFLRFLEDLERIDGRGQHEVAPDHNVAIFSHRRFYSSGPRHCEGDRRLLHIRGSVCREVLGFVLCAGWSQERGAGNS